MVRPVYLCLIIILLAACSDVTTPYFPTRPDLSWDYRTTISGHKGTTRTQRIIVQNQQLTATENGDRLIQRSLEGRDVTYEITAAGVYWLAEGERRLHLGLPIKPGRRWTQTTNLITLDIFGPAYRTSERLETQFELTYTIRGTDGRVSVPAGDFTNCLVVTGKGQVHVDRRVFLGVDVIHAEETRWYAPDVGLVKRERREYTEPKEFDGSLVQELVRFDSG